MFATAIYIPVVKKTITAWLALTHEQLEAQRCMLSTVATDALVLKHQVISIHSAD